ncbi:hypothetical protein LTR09_002461 [Extremus antarcticus]|uniref:Ice-binding protein n=1 Tax=Extremus antarcticus TaxID=702011 RepID=A0AAJ0GFW1_9PEZI|nr:hypothetical protein LTR09_002461 [Extremus antarcticus]
MRRIIPICYCIVGWAIASHAQIVNLGTAATFGALAPAGVTNTGSTIVNGNVGTTGTSITGFPPGLITGTFEISNDVAAQAQADFNAAYVQGTNLAPTTDQAGLATLSGLNLTAGVYKFDSGITLDGTLTLSGGGDFVFQLTSTLTTMSDSRVVLTNGASACNVYWIIGSAATIGTSTSFAGNVLAYTAITLTTSATVQGGLYAGSAVTLDSNLVNACGAASFVNTTASPTSPATLLPVPSTTATVIASPITFPTSPNAISTTTLTGASPISYHTSRTIAQIIVDSIGHFAKHSTSYCINHSIDHFIDHLAIAIGKYYYYPEIDHHKPGFNCDRHDNLQADRYDQN